MSSSAPTLCSLLAPSCPPRLSPSLIPRERERSLASREDEPSDITYRGHARFHVGPRCRYIPVMQMKQPAARERLPPSSFFFSSTYHSPLPLSSFSPVMATPALVLRAAIRMFVPLLFSFFIISSFSSSRHTGLLVAVKTVSSSIARSPASYLRRRCLFAITAAVRLARRSILLLVIRRFQTLHSILADHGGCTGAFRLALSGNLSGNMRTARIPLGIFSQFEHHLEKTFASEFGELV